MEIKYFDDIKCLWMKSGTVDYRLCDNNFNCEKCWFNENIRIGMQKNNDSTNDFSLDSSNMNFSHPYYHSKNGLLLKSLVFGVYYIGFDSYISTLLTPETTAKFVYENDKVPEGINFISLTGQWGRIKVSSPFEFKFVEKFDIASVLHDRNKWFGVIEADNIKLNSRIMNKNEYENKMSYVKDNDVNLFDLIQSPVGNTMYDGGNIIIEPEKICNKSEYKKLLTFLLKE